MITPNKFHLCSYWCLEEKRKIITRYLMSNVYRLFCGTVAEGGYEHSLNLILCFYYAKVNSLGKCLFQKMWNILESVHFTSSSYNFNLEYHFFDFTFVSIVFFFNNHKKEIVMKRFSDTDFDGKSNNCYFMMNCLNLSFLFRYRSWSQSFRCSLLILRFAK